MVGRALRSNTSRAACEGVDENGRDVDEETCLATLLLDSCNNKGCQKYDNVSYRERRSDLKKVAGETYTAPRLDSIMQECLSNDGELY